MPRVRVSISLPFALSLADGEYPTAEGGASIRIEMRRLQENSPQTVVAADFEHGEIPDPDDRHKAGVGDADRLLRRTNRLLRWYRAVRQRADITELTRAQASPFQFNVVDNPASAEWVDPIVFEETAPIPLELSVEQITDRVRRGLANGNDPDVDVLFLLDARRAMHQGRFREAVLFCWSTIDSVFNRKYDLLVDTALADEWSDARKFFKGLEFGLRNKMSAAMRFVANRSLFNESNDLWDKISRSYAKRNGIIHRGENASEDEARLAIDVALGIVDIMNAIPDPPPAKLGADVSQTG